jgi:hypothetical protein
VGFLFSPRLVRVRRPHAFVGRGAWRGADVHTRGAGGYDPRQVRTEMRKMDREMRQEIIELRKALPVGSQACVIS